MKQLLRSVREHLLAVSDKRFVSSVFEGLLWRSPDSHGLQWYVGGLRSGRMSRFKVLRDVGQSEEAAKFAMFGPGYRNYVRSFVGGGAEVSAPPVLFLHPMKCGGTALTQGLSRLCDPWPRIVDTWADQLVCFPRPMLSAVRLVTGHLPYGAVEVLGDDVVTVTVVREPVARTLSHFTHLREQAGETSLTLASFVRDRRDVWGDYQARQLAVDVPVGAAWRGEWPVELQSFVDSPPSMSADDLRRRALERLAAITIVGVSESLDDVARAVARVWGKPAPEPLRRENPSLAPLRRDDVPADLLAEIEAGTRIDAELHAAAQVRAATLV